MTAPIEQVFVDCRVVNGEFAAVLTSNYQSLNQTIHLGMDYVEGARRSAQELGLPGFWRVKGGAE